MPCLEINRVIPEKLNALINLSSLEVHPVFQLIRKIADVDEREMLRTFNMGAGNVTLLSISHLLLLSALPLFMKRFATLSVTASFKVILLRDGPICDLT